MRGLSAIDMRAMGSSHKLELIGGLARWGTLGDLDAPQQTGRIIGGEHPSVRSTLFLSRFSMP
jgi:hypothetical protein